jgi:hypothetical protein
MGTRADDGFALYLMRWQRAGRFPMGHGKLRSGKAYDRKCRACLQWHSMIDERLPCICD